MYARPVALAALAAIVGLAVAGSPLLQNRPRLTAPAPVAYPDQLSTLIQDGRRAAAGLLPHPRLTELTASGVERHGSLDPRRGTLTLTFEQDPPPPRPPGYDDGLDPGCVRVEYRAPRGVTQRTTQTVTCVRISDGVGLDPRCTASALWAMAIAEDAPAGLASLALYAREQTWFFGGKGGFARDYPDTCTSMPAE